VLAGSPRPHAGERLQREEVFKLNLRGEG